MNKDILNILANSNKDIDNQQLMDYLSGKLSGEDLHELERSMAGDEFLNDAVEGLQQVKNPKNMQAYVDQLNADMHKSLEKKKTRRLRRKLPRAKIMIGLWTEMDTAKQASAVMESAKADLMASSLRDAIRMCIESIRPDQKVYPQRLDARPVAADQAT